MTSKRRLAPWGAAVLMLAALTSSIGRAVQPTPPDVEALLTRLDGLYRSTSSIARIELQVTTPRSTRSLRLKAWTRGEDEALIIIESPPREEGTATLRVGPNLWPGNLEEARALVRERMEGAFKLDVPLEVATGIGENWYETK